MLKPKLIRITTVPISLHKLLSNQLKYMSAHYEVIAVSSGGEYLKKVGITQGVRTEAVEMTRGITPMADLLALWKLYCLIRYERPLIVHTHTPKAGILGMLAAWMAGVPVRMHTVAGMPLLETSGLKRKLLDVVERLTCAAATNVYPNSHAMKSIICKLGYCNETKLKVIGNGSSNGIDIGTFDPALFDAETKYNLRKALNIGDDDIVFCFIGRLVPDKGIHELIDAFVALSAANSRVKLLMIGPFESHLAPLARETVSTIQSHPNIRFLGYQEQVAVYLAISHIFVFPSYREGLPNVVMQAGAMELPCIVTDISGCNEIIIDGRNGVIIPPKDTSALHRAMSFLLNREDIRQQMAAESRELIVSRYEQHVLWRHLFDEYRSVVTRTVTNYPHPRGLRRSSTYKLWQ